MQDSDILLSENEGFKFVSVRFSPFKGNTTYTYKTLDDVEEGDIYVVQTPNNGLGLVEVVEVHAEPYSGKTNWLAQKVDLTVVTELQEKEKNLKALLRKSKGKKLLAAARAELLDSLPEGSTIEALTRL